MRFAKSSSETKKQASGDKPTGYRLAACNASNRGDGREDNTFSLSFFVVLLCFLSTFFFFFLFLAAYYYLRAVWKRARVVLNEFVRCKHISVSYFLARCLFSFALVFPSDVFAEANAVSHKVMSGIAVPNSR